MRGWMSGRNTIRLPIQDLVALAKGMGLLSSSWHSLQTVVTNSPSVTLRQS